MQTLVGRQEFLLKMKTPLLMSGLMHSFFEAFKDKMLADARFELNIEFESDNNLIWREGNDVCRVIITKLQLYIPSVKFDERCKITTAIKPKSWTYLNE